MKKISDRAEGEIGRLGICARGIREAHHHAVREADVPEERAPLLRLMRAEAEPRAVAVQAKALRELGAQTAERP
jgi:hypothetical protein